MKQPPLITYNLKKRGRQYRGQERNFNIHALCDSINGPATQERVKTRAMLGFFGHAPRILAGMEPTESIVVGGRYNEIEPAIVTTHLQAYPDGTIEHQTEFLDSIPGKKAARMHANRIGGFSSAIDESKPELFGFDYVLDPNFSTNRGFALDSANLTFDQVLDSMQLEEEEFWLKLVAGKEAQIEQMALSLDHAQADNEQLLSMLASMSGKTVLDDASFIAPMTVPLEQTERIKKDTDLFRKAAVLPRFVEAADAHGDQDHAYRELLNRMGYLHV